MKIYLAGPFFNESEIAFNDRLLNIVNSAFPKAEVYIPKSLKVERKDEVLDHYVWARNIFFYDVANLDNADLVIAHYGGLYSDTGTTWEIGYAFAKGIYTIVVLTDPYANQSLMPYFGCSQVATFGTIESVLKSFTLFRPVFK